MTLTEYEFLKVFRGYKICKYRFLKEDSDTEEDEIISLTPHELDVTGSDITFRTWGHNELFKWLPVSKELDIDTILFMSESIKKAEGIEHMNATDEKTLKFWKIPTRYREEN